MPNAVSDAKLGLEKINEFGLGQGKIPTVSFSITIAEPDMLQSVSPDVVQGIMTIVANWGSKGHEAPDRRTEGQIQRAVDDPETSSRPMATMWLMKARAGKKPARPTGLAVAQAFPDHGMAARRNIIRGGELKFRRKGPPGRCRRRHRAVAIGACPSPSIPPELAVAQPFWPKRT